jgi:hypothetical protein
MSEILPVQMKAVLDEVRRKIKCIFACVFHFVMTTLWSAVRVVDDAETLIADDEDAVRVADDAETLIADDDLHVDPGNTGSFGDCETPEAVVRDDDDDDDLEWADCTFGFEGTRSARNSRKMRPRGCAKGQPCLDSFRERLPGCHLLEISFVFVVFFLVVFSWRCRFEPQRCKPPRIGVTADRRPNG